MAGAVIPTRLRVVLFAVITVPLSCGGFATWVSAAGPVPFTARDLDCSGFVTPGEWYSAGLDYGWRDADDPNGCWEVFQLKDGYPHLVRCSSVPRCRLWSRDGLLEPSE